MAYSRFIYSALLSSDVASQNQAGSEPGPSLEARLSSPRRFPASPPPVRDARYRWASRGRETPQGRHPARNDGWMDGLGRSSWQLCLQEGSVDSQAAAQRHFLMELWVLGAAFINQIRTQAPSLGVRVSRREKETRILPTLC